MPIKKILAAISGLFVFFLILYYALLFFAAKPQQIQQITLQTVETITGGKFQYQQFKLHYFPRLQSEFGSVVLEGQDPSPFEFKAKKAKFHFSFWGFLLGKANIANIDIEGGEIHFPAPLLRLDSLDMENLDVKIRTQHGLRKITAIGDGDLEGMARALSGKLILEMNDPAHFVWNQTSIIADFNLKDFSLLAPFQKKPVKNGGFVLKEGNLSGTFRGEKNKEDAWLHVTGETQLKRFLYQIQEEINSLESPALDAQMDFALDQNPLEEQIFLKRCTLLSPLGKLEISGRYHLPTREIKDGRITFTDLLLESIPQYYLPIREAVPFNLGFSGRSYLEMAAQGTLDHLSMHGNWDLAPTLLTYANIFSKPKDTPCTLSFDILLRNHQLLSGDFSLRLQEAGFKGALTNLDLVAGTGQFNILSNKFKLENWAALLTPFEGYKIAGDFKILANMEGNLLQKPEEVKSMVNVILEKGEISKGEDRLSNIYLAADYSPISLEIKNAQLQSGESPLVMNATIYDPRTAPHATVHFSSDELDLSQMLRSIDNLGKKWFPTPFKKRLRRFRDSLDTLLPQGQTLQKLNANIEAKPEEVLIRELKTQLYQGTLEANGKIADPMNHPALNLHTEINQLNLARFFNRSSDSPKLMEGNFFFKGDFQSKDLDSEDWASGLSGKGVFSVTNGEFSTFSVMKAVGNIPALSILAEDAVSTTPFDDFQSQFEIADKKIKMEKATIISRDLKAYGDGETALSGALNYRLNAYLSYGAAKQVLESYLGANSQNGEDFLGPIPLLLSGDWKSPELKTDPSRIADFTENFAKKKVQKVLRNFLPEDVLFKRPNKS